MEESSSRDKGKSAMLEMLRIPYMITVPLSLVAVVRLNVADAIWQGGAHVPLSAAEILSLIQPPPATAVDADPGVLQRFLRLLSSHGVFREHFDAASGQRKYSLTETGKTLVTDSGGLSFAPYIMLRRRHYDNVMRAPLFADDQLVYPTTPERQFYGESVDHYYMRPELTELRQKATAGISVPFMKAMLDDEDCYKGFDGVERLVDVGGSGGDCLRMIIAKFPCIRQAINFDLPQVIAIAPIIPGVTHVGGDMFKSIPSCNAIFMKSTMGGWTYEECKVIMKNCYDALTPTASNGGGKLIMVEPVVPDDVDDSLRTRTLLEGDVFVMAMIGTESKMKTEEEWKQLGLAVGFSKFKAFYSFDHFLAVLEFEK